MLRNRSIKKLTAVSRKRKVIASSFDAAETVGVVMPCCSDTDKTAFALESIAKKYNMQITVAVYFPEYELLEGAARNRSKIVFSDRDCNWFGKPKMSEIQNFINTGFDMLIDLSLKTTWFPLKYAVAASKACFKVGYVSENVNLYDFLLLGNDTEENLIRNTETYLQKLKRNE